MANRQEFYGGLTGSSPGLTNDTPNTYIQDDCIWHPGNTNRDGQTQVYLNAIAAYNASGAFDQTIAKGGTNWHAGDTIYGSSGSVASVRLFDNSSSQLTFYKTPKSGYTVWEYRTSDGAYIYSWSNQALVGYYDWSTVPSAPSSASASRSGRSVTVTGGTSSDNGGSTISSYKVQYRTSADGSTGWSAWGNEQTLSSGTYTYTSLTPALYYQFRVYGVNGVGNSAGTSTSNVFVSGGGKRWDGGAWQATTTAKRWNGSSWVDLTTAKRWNGSAWVDLG